VLSQIGREEKAAAAEEVSPIVRHRTSMAQLKAMGFAEPAIGPATSGRTRWLNPSYGLASLSRPLSGLRLIKVTSTPRLRIDKKALSKPGGFRPDQKLHWRTKGLADRRTNRSIRGQAA
jgi:hypothetical protein